MTIRNKISLTTAHYLWLVIFIITLLVMWVNLVEYFRFDRRMIGDGQIWLLFSAHFAHLNWTHWALNMGGLAIVAFFFTAYGSVMQWLVVVIVSCFFVGAGLYWFNPQIYWYVGLSGVLHGLFIYGAIKEIKVQPVSGIVLMTLLVGKLTWEMFNGSLPGSEDMVGGHVITDSHLYGAVAGMCCGVIELILRKIKSNEPVN